jgi:hypothetical protein
VGMGRCGRAGDETRPVSGERPHIVVIRRRR